MTNSSYSNVAWERDLREIILDLDIPDGDFVECGTWVGSSAKLLAEKCNHTVHLFDSWQGVSEVGEFDNPIYNTFNWSSELSICQYHLSDNKNVEFYKGWIPNRFNEISEKKISLLHLDLSIYQPTKDSLEFFWERLIPGGYVIGNFHDGYSYGAEKAVRDFFNGLRDISVKSSGICVVRK